MLPKTSMTYMGSTERLPDKDFKIDFDKKCIGGMIEGVDALKQAICIALLTERYRYPIFPHSFGTDYNDALDGGYMKAMGKIKNAIEDSLLCDDRILSISDFEFSRIGKKIAVKFKVSSIYGTIDYETEVA
ncbi:MAG: DUF2634 domain-containing protein [Clostridia bacterium]